MLQIDFQDQLATRMPTGEFFEGAVEEKKSSFYFTQIKLLYRNINARYLML